MSETLKLETYDIYQLRDKVKQRKSEKSEKRNIVELIENFIDSECNCCRVCSCDDSKQALMESSGLRRTIRNEGFRNVITILRGTEVFLVKKDRWEEILNKGAGDCGKTRKTADSRSEK